ncbi:L-seryl-tRNA(Sec) selenium transferase [Virgibacillus sp. MSP4-1]|uniref:L-seryl-tRNA(Sec) selenium transferase n=1 Tax=Virgibacillus sp. MSP4-1 TaxID=2700081 RepID=UPI0003A4C216|nr:L-seryl-tRNA(Sec) selenium transferase [Virgibacillus sp. MSP4-1]QHS22352.1 L-seryl-tRNA(Sec) selenium transferase [Virgibacillus sp. MSP4-1]
MKELLRRIPPVHDIQRKQEIKEIQEHLNITREKLKHWIQTEIEHVRQLMMTNKREFQHKEEIEKYILYQVKQKSMNWKKDNLTRVINATGTILHTNLGRARLSDESLEHVANVAKHYSNLEYSTKKGERGSRHSIVEELIKEVTGAEAALVVNNNAAAVYLTLRALAKNQEIIVSRGELVEIGGSFRVSSIMSESDAQLVEVGTTNKTHDFDYVDAINEQTAMILKVHTSNFKITGFTEQVNTEDLATIANKNRLIYYEDLGSGALINLKDYGIGDEPVVRDILEAGAHLVSFSGDKLLGGPQAGIVAGRKDLIDVLKRHQLARVLRVDKMTLAALETTLRMYAKGTHSSLMSIPAIRDILRPASEIMENVQAFLEKATANTMLTFDIRDSYATIGGGTMPDEQVQSYGVLVQSNVISPEELESRLRNQDTPVIGRFLDEKLFLDFRTLDHHDIDQLHRILASINQDLEVM